MIHFAQETDSKIIFSWASGFIDAEPEDPIYETESGPYKPNFVTLPEYSSLIKSAWEASYKIENQGLAREARSLLSLIQETVESFKQLGFDLGALPEFQLSGAMDGSILVEWIFKNFRVGFSFEAHQEESSWYLVSDKNLGDIGASGYISGLSMEKTFLWLLNFVISHQ